MSECCFKLDHYRDTLKKYIFAGYKLIDFDDYFAMRGNGGLPEKFVLLRHDIDFSPRMAADLVVAELAIGTKSTLFVRLHARQYNILSAENLHQLWWTMSIVGCSAGIHLEPDMVGLAGIEDRDQWLESCVKILNTIMSKRLCAASIHCVAKGILDTEWMRDALGRLGIPLVTHNMPGLKYLSDSNGRWREGCFCQWIDREPRIHLLTHPIWWFDRSPQENY